LKNKKFKKVKQYCRKCFLLHNKGTFKYHMKL